MVVARGLCSSANTAANWYSVCASIRLQQPKPGLNHAARTSALNSSAHHRHAPATQVGSRANSVHLSAFCAKRTRCSQGYHVKSRHQRKPLTLAQVSHVGASQAKQKGGRVFSQVWLKESLKVVVSTDSPFIHIMAPNLSSNAVGPEDSDFQASKRSVYLPSKLTSNAAANVRLHCSKFLVSSHCTGTSS